MTRLFSIIGILVVVGLMIYIRKAPHNVEKEHQLLYPSTTMGDEERSGAFIHRRAIEPASSRRTLVMLDSIILHTPRTERLAGSIEERMITYVTRSFFWRFPDYTTVAIRSDGIEDEPDTWLEIHGRLRFGKSDFGANRKRIKKWLREFEATR